MKALAKIGIVWFVTTLIFLCTFNEFDNKMAIAWGVMGLLYAIVFAVVVLFKSEKANQDNN